MVTFHLWCKHIARFLQCIITRPENKSISGAVCQQPCGTPDTSKAPMGREVPETEWETESGPQDNLDPLTLRHLRPSLECAECPTERGSDLHTREWDGESFLYHWLPANFLPSEISSPAFWLSYLLKITAISHPKKSVFCIHAADQFQQSNRLTLSWSAYRRRWEAGRRLRIDIKN